MHQRLPRHTTALLCAAGFALSWSTFAIQAQMPAAGKRPITYDVYDAWRSIHHLLGKPKPEWIEKGVPYLERGRRDVSDMFKPKSAATTTATAAR